MVRDLFRKLIRGVSHEHDRDEKDEKQKRAHRTNDPFAAFPIKASKGAKLDFLSPTKVML